MAPTSTSKSPAAAEAAAEPKSTEAAAEPTAAPTSKKTPKPGDALAFRTSSVPGLLLVQSLVSAEPTEVVGLHIRDGEYPRAFNVYVYDSAAEADAASAADAVERREHVAYWPA